MQNALREHFAILSTFIKLPFIFKTFVLSIFERPLKTGFTVFGKTAAITVILLIQNLAYATSKRQNIDL